MYDNFFLTFGPRLYLGAALVSGVLSTLSLTAFYVIASIEQSLLLPSVDQLAPALTDEQIQTVLTRSLNKNVGPTEKVLM
jgi:hypothetical protein